MKIVWTSDLNTEIDVIDNQHKRLVDYLNQLEVAIQQQSRLLVQNVLDDLIEYTESHFAFEESLLEEVAYPQAATHKAVHELFIKRVARYQEKHNKGEAVAEQLHAMLSAWLMQHIKCDDMAYASAVKGSIHQVIQDEKDESWLTRSLTRFFGAAH
jgi:hemerythrin